MRMLKEYKIIFLSLVPIMHGFKEAKSNKELWVAMWQGGFKEAKSNKEFWVAMWQGGFKEAKSKEANSIGRSVYTMAM